MVSGAAIETGKHEPAVAYAAGTLRWVPGRGQVPQELLLTDVQRVIWVRKRLPRPTAEDDTAWVIEARGAAYLLPVRSGLWGLLVDQLAEWADRAKVLYAATYTSSPLGWGTFKWNRAMHRETAEYFAVTILRSLLAQAELHGPLTLAQMRSQVEG
ncbi:MAG: hypothetical protein KGJ44_03050 [Betaproteobacteria bacterium]|nr:hypothetical protein [Betaproteobacteria bacterium]